MADRNRVSNVRLKVALALVGAAWCNAGCGALIGLDPGAPIDFDATPTPAALAEAGIYPALSSPAIDPPAVSEDASDEASMPIVAPGEGAVGALAPASDRSSSLAPDATAAAAPPTVVPPIAPPTAVPSTPSPAAMPPTVPPSEDVADGGGADEAGCPKGKDHGEPDAAPNGSASKCKS